MWIKRIDVESQTIIIENHDGEQVAICPLPRTRQPNPGREWLMEQAANQVALSLVVDLVYAANKGLERERAQCS